MTSIVPLPRRIEVLLNTLSSERYFPRPFLGELIEALLEAGAAVSTVRPARALLDRMDRGLPDPERQRLVARVVDSVRASLARGDDAAA